MAGIHSWVFSCLPTFKDGIGKDAKIEVFEVGIHFEGVCDTLR